VFVYGQGRFEVVQKYYGQGGKGQVFSDVFIGTYPWTVPYLILLEIIKFRYLLI